MTAADATTAAGVGLFHGQALAGRWSGRIGGVARDSRALRPGEAFVAVGSPEACARNAAAAAVAGAGLVIAERPVGVAAWVATPHARWSFAAASARQHGLDRRCPPLVGVTGTKGKTTTAHAAWWALGDGAARVGTLGYHDGREPRPGTQTTPPPDELHGFLAGLPASCPGVALEVSSHAGDQQRLAGLRLRALAYAGLGRDHLDYHRTIPAYLAAKLRALRWLAPGGLCIVNADDARAHVWAHAARGAGARVLLLGLQGGDARVIEALGGWRLAIDGVDHPLPVRLPGAFNAWNAAAGALLAWGAGVPLSTALARLAEMPAVPGRLEPMAQHPLTYVDYAHTAESIAAVVAALRAAHPGRRLALVFGCGGDRDRGKRGPMGAAAAAADAVVVTTDNARSEDPAAIAREVLAGIPGGERAAWGAVAAGDDARVAVELDRGRAIALGRRLAGADGVAVVCGKGHETTQEIQGVVHAWDDRAFVAGLGGHP